MLKRIMALFVLLMSFNAFTQTYKIGMIEWIAYSPLNVAEHKGIWKKHGIDVQVVNFNSNQALNKALESGEIDIALDMIGSWVGMYLNGVDLVILGETDWSFGGDKIIAKKGSDITAASLKGKEIGIYLNQPSVTYFLNQFLESKKVPFKDIKAVEKEPGAMADAFIKGDYSIIVNYDPDASRAEAKGNGETVATSKTFPGSIPEGFVTTKKALETKLNEEVLIKIFKGWSEAVEWMTDTYNWNDYVQIAQKYTFPTTADSEKTPEAIRGMLKGVRIHPAKKQLVRNTTGLKSYLQDLDAFLKSSGLINNYKRKEVKVDEILNNSALIKALK